MNLIARHKIKTVSERLHAHQQAEVNQKRSCEKRAKKIFCWNGTKARTCVPSRYHDPRETYGKRATQIKQARLRRPPGRAETQMNKATRATAREHRRHQEDASCGNPQPTTTPGTSGNFGEEGQLNTWLLASQSASALLGSRCSGKQIQQTEIDQGQRDAGCWFHAEPLPPLILIIIVTSFQNCVSVKQPASMHQSSAHN